MAIVVKHLQSICTDKANVKRLVKLQGITAKCPLSVTDNAGTQEATGILGEIQ